MPRKSPGNGGAEEQTKFLRLIWEELKSLGKNLGGRIDATNARLDETNQRLDQTNQRLDQTNQRLDQTNQRLDQTNQCARS